MMALTRLHDSVDAFDDTGSRPGQGQVINWDLPASSQKGVVVSHCESGQGYGRNPPHDA